MKRKYLVTAVTVLLLLAIALPAGAQTIWQTYGNVRAKQLNVLGATDLDGALNVDGATTLASFTADTINSSGNASVDGTLSVNGDALSIAAQVAIAPLTAISVTDGGIITTTGTIQMLEAGGNVTATLAPGTSGEIVTLINTSNVTITVEDTTGQILSSDIALGQWDTATVVYYGVSWVQLAESDN